MLVMPRPKLEISVAPGKKVPFLPRVRRNPTKSFLASLKKFNQMVEKGKIKNPQMGSDGAITLSSLSHSPGSPGFKAARRIYLTSRNRSPEFIKSARGNVGRREMDKIEERVFQYELKGNFVFVNPLLEQGFLRGYSPERMLGLSFAPSAQKAAALEKVRASLSSRESMESNIRRQLIFFRDLLLKTNEHELVLYREFSPVDSASTRIVVEKGKISRITTSLIPEHNSNVQFIVTLEKNGRLSFKTIEGKIRNDSVN